MNITQRQKGTLYPLLGKGQPFGDGPTILRRSMTLLLSLYGK